MKMQQRREIPILFSSLMVLAILDNLKSQTRRVMNPMTPEAFALMVNLNACVNVESSKAELIRTACPYGHAGDILWVKESHYRYGHWVPDGITNAGRPKWRFVALNDEVRFVDNPPEKFRKAINKNDPGTGTWYKRNSLFMPRECARIFLLNEGVRVQRLQEISEADAIAEGIERYNPIDDLVAYRDYSGVHKDFINTCSYGFDFGKEVHSAPVASFCTLWELVNGTGSWLNNDWLWAINFKILSTTGRPDLAALN